MVFDVILPENDNVIERTIFTECILVFGIARRRFDCFSPRMILRSPNFSFLLADCQGVKAPFRFDFVKQMTFSVSNFVFGEDHIMLTCFEMWFLNTLKQSGQVLGGIKNI